MKSMKTCKSVSAAILAALTLGLSFGSVQNCNAQTNTNVFPARINLVCITTNATGGLVYERVKTAEFVEECALDMGVTNFSGLSLVFNRSNSSLEVVSRTNLTNVVVLCTPFSFEGGTSLTNSNGTRVELQAYVFLEASTNASGLLSATERLTYGTSNQLTSFGLRGEIYYSFTDGTNSPTICRGTLLVGSAITHRIVCPEDDDDDDDDNNGNPGQGHGNQGQGNNGNHGNGNNGNHGLGNNGNGNGNNGNNGNGNNGNNGNGNGNNGNGKGKGKGKP
jgi:hypothetical protein